MTAADLPPGQKRCLTALWDHLSECGEPPTFRDLGRRLGVNLNAVVGHLRGLARKGLVELPVGGAVRSIWPAGFSDRVAALARELRPDAGGGPTGG